MKPFQTIAKLIPTIIITHALCIGIAMSAECTSVVHQFGEHLSTWASNRCISNLHAMEALCSKSPSFRIGDKLMTSMADKNSLTKTDTYDWDNYITCLQKEVDNGLQVTFSNISLIPEGYIEIDYPGVQYVSCRVKVNGSLSYELTDLFILKDEKIVKITDYVERIDETTGKKKIEVDYLELARAAFGDGDYQKCYNLYKKGGLKKLKSKEKRIIGGIDIFPYIESCVALKDWNGAMDGFTKIMNRKYWVNGVEWTLNPEDIRNWTISKAPLMNVLLEKLYSYYKLDVSSFKKSPLLNHIKNIENLSIEDYEHLAAEFFWQNKRLWCDKTIPIKSAAEFGNINAQRQLGKLYLKGYMDKTGYSPSLPCDTIKAMYWFNKAAMNGDTESIKLVSSYKLNGEGVDRDFEGAYSYYLMSKSETDYDIQYGLGLCYYYGMGTTQDKQTALSYLSLVEDWHCEIPFLIGNIYYEMLDPKAIKYYQKVLRRTGANMAVRREILKRLADCYRIGKCGLSQNETEANRLEVEVKNIKETDASELRNYFISLTKTEIEDEVF